jgi:lycopene cyclase domain-containing protein
MGEGIPEYTVLTVLSIAGVVLLELVWLRTGLFAMLQYWVSMVIVFGFQVLMDGWLTKLSNPIVLYADSEFSGIRVPWDIPIEDFGFGFSMITLALLAWLRLTRRADRITEALRTNTEQA